MRCVNGILWCVAVGWPPRLPERRRGPAGSRTRWPPTRSTRTLSALERLLPRAHTSSATSRTGNRPKSGEWLLSQARQIALEYRLEGRGVCRRPVSRCSAEARCHELPNQPLPLVTSAFVVVHHPAVVQEDRGLSRKSAFEHAHAYCFSAATTDDSRVVPTFLLPVGHSSSSTQPLHSGFFLQTSLACRTIRAWYSPYSSGSASRRSIK